MTYKNKIKGKIENVLLERNKIYKISSQVREYKLSYEIETLEGKDQLTILVKFHLKNSITM